MSLQLVLSGPTIYSQSIKIIRAAGPGLSSHTQKQQDESPRCARSSPVPGADLSLSDIRSGRGYTCNLPYRPEPSPQDEHRLLYLPLQTPQRCPGHAALVAASGWRNSLVVTGTLLVLSHRHISDKNALKVNESSAGVIRLIFPAPRCCYSPALS